MKFQENSFTIGHNNVDGRVEQWYIFLDSYMILVRKKHLISIYEELR